MKGVVTKKDVLTVARVFGVRKALRLVFTREPVALLILMK